MLAKLRYPAMRSSDRRTSRPWAAKAARVNRKASVPNCLDDLQRIDDVAPGLAHLLALGVPHQGMDVDIPEGNVPHELEPHHHHPGHPEEEDVKPGHQDGGRVEDFQVLGAVRPAQGGKRPQRGAEPGIQHVGFLLHGRAAAGFASGHRLGGDDDLAAVPAEPGRDPVPPPDLAGDAPVADIVHPVEVGILPGRGDDPGLAFRDRLDRRFGQGFHPHEPLLGDQRLDDRLAPVTVADAVGEGLDLLEAGLPFSDPR